MLPLFYSIEPANSNDFMILEEDASKHVVQVLRMKKGDRLQLTDGIGNLYTGEIIHDHKKKVEVRIQEKMYNEPGSKKITIAISILKNAARFEWFLEKATEIGISAIRPLICERTERQHFRADRLQNILISAMLQSHQCWLPALHDPASFTQIVNESSHSQKFIAHCVEQKKTQLADVLDDSLPERIMLIGPEGDFSTNEIALAIQKGFTPVSLGENRLRSETAGVVASAMLRLNG